MNPACTGIRVGLCQRLPGGSCFSDRLAIAQSMVYELVDERYVDPIQSARTKVVDSDAQAPLEVLVSLDGYTPLLSARTTDAKTWNVGTVAESGPGDATARCGTYSPRSTWASR